MRTLPIVDLCVLGLGAGTGSGPNPPYAVAYASFGPRSPAITSRRPRQPQAPACRRVGARHAPVVLARWRIGALHLAALRRRGHLSCPYRWLATGGSSR
jgi:hypothetical protein